MIKPALLDEVEVPAHVNKITNFMIFILIFMENCLQFDIMQYTIFHYGREPVLIHRILNGFEAILENWFSC